MSVSPYAVAGDAINKHRQEVNPHPQYALAATVAKQLAGKANVGAVTTVAPTVVAASSSSVTVHTHIIADVTGLQAVLDGKAASVHSHTISEVTSLQAALDAKAAIAHGHAQSDVTNLVSDLAGKAASVHTHAQSDVTGLVTALAGKVPTTRIVGGQDSIQIATGTDLSGDVTLNLIGDDDAPGNSKLYGTDGSGVKGWYNQPAGGAANIKETEIDFGSTPVSEASFLITDSDVSAGSQLIGTVAYVAPTGKDLDELEMDGLDLKFAPGAGQFTLYARGLDGYVADKFKIFYMIG